MKLKDFLVGSVGMLPMICFYAYIAMSVEDISKILSEGSTPDDWYIGLMLAGGVLMLVTVVLMTFKAKK